MSAAPVTRSGIVPGVPEAEYHSNPALSSTGARLLLDSPARFQWAQTHPQAPKAAFDLGSAVHSQVLGTGYGVVELDFPDFRTNAAKEARDAVYAAGQIPILAGDAGMAEVKAISESVLAHPTARAFLEQAGIAEASVFATCPDTGVAVRARYDFLPNAGSGQRRCVDLKTTGKSASPSEFAKTAANFGYDVKDGWYTDTLKFVTGEDAAMVFIVVETTAPYLVAVHQLDREYRDMGKVKALAARMTFRDCTEADEWPGYPPTVNLLAPPVFAIYDYQDRFSA